MNAAIAAAARRGQGMGEGLARALAARGDLPGRDASVMLAALEHDVPVTVHAAIGAEIIHQHPTADGAALGATSHRDFRRLAGSLPRLDQGGAVLNWGSAVVLPEVFLKALTIARNLEGGRPTGFLAADFDMQRHYRPRHERGPAAHPRGRRGLSAHRTPRADDAALVWGVARGTARLGGATRGQTHWTPRSCRQPAHRPAA